MTDTDIREAVDAVNSRRLDMMEVASGVSTEAKARFDLGFSRLASWQESLVALGSSMVDREELYPKTIATTIDCPSPCKSCTFEHGGLFKGEEKDKFKCILDGKDR